MLSKSHIYPTTTHTQTQDITVKNLSPKPGVVQVSNPSTRQGDTGGLLKVGSDKTTKNKSSCTLTYESSKRHNWPPQNQAVALCISLDALYLQKRNQNPLNVFIQIPQRLTGHTCPSLSTEVPPSGPPGSELTGLILLLPGSVSSVRLPCSGVQKSLVCTEHCWPIKKGRFLVTSPMTFTL